MEGEVKQGNKKREKIISNLRFENSKRQRQEAGIGAEGKEVQIQQGRNIGIGLDR